MNILIVSQTFARLDRAGRTVQARGVAERLAQRGYAVTVLTANYQHPDAAEVEQRGGVEVVYAPILARYRALTLNRGVVSFCRSRLHQFDMVHVYGLYDLLGPIVTWHSRQWRIPYVVQPMGMWRPIARNVWLKQGYHALLGRPMLQGASRIIATSAQEAEELQRAGLEPSRIAVIRNGVAGKVPKQESRGAWRARWGIPAEATIVLFLGRLTSKKNLPLLVEAFAAVAGQVNGSRQPWLVLVGPDEGDGHRHELERLVDQRGLRDRARFIGPVYGEEKWQALAAADLFVLPSQHENFGNAVAEAMACGVPVIISDQCGIAPYVRDRAGLVIPPEPHALAQAMRTLLADPSLQRRYAEGARQVAQTLSWEEPLAQLEALYRDVFIVARRR